MNVLARLAAVLTVFRGRRRRAAVVGVVNLDAPDSSCRDGWEPLDAAPRPPAPIGVTLTTTPTRAPRVVSSRIQVPDLAHLDDARDVLSKIKIRRRKGGLQ